MTHPPEVIKAVKVLWDYLKQENPRVNQPETTQQPSQFNLSSIKWKVGSGTDRKDASPDEPYSYAFVKDMKGQIHPEIKPLYDAVCRYGEVHTQGWVITLFGDRTQMLSKRKPKEA